MMIATFDDDLNNNVAYNNYFDSNFSLLAVDEKTATTMLLIDYYNKTIILMMTATFHCTNPFL